MAVNIFHAYAKLPELANLVQTGSPAVFNQNVQNAGNFYCSPTFNALQENPNAIDAYDFAGQMNKGAHATQDSAKCT